MGFAGANQSAVTPYRKTHLRVDVSEVVLREPVFGSYRTASQMARANSASQNVQYLESGAWALQPLARDLSNLHEQTDATGSIIPASDYQLVPGMVEREIWRAPTDLMGVTVGTGVAATADPFIVKTVPAGQSWAQSFDADMASFPQIPYKTQNVSVDRVAVGKVAYPANQGFTVRVVVNAWAPHHTDVVGALYFGGPADVDATGVYGLEIRGNGELHLYDCHPDSGSPGHYHFSLADYWDAFPRTATNQVLVIAIWPHIDATGRPTIEFRTETTSNTASRGSVFTSLTSSGGNPKVHVWRGIRQYRGMVTGPGPIRVEMPRTARTPYQVSLLNKQATGRLVDDPFCVPFYPSNANPISLVWQGSRPPGTALTGRLFNLRTNAELAIVASGPNFRTYTIPAGDYHYYPQFDFTSDAGQTASSYLYNYRTVRDGVYGLETRTEVDAGEVGGFVRNYSITGPEKDATHETASFLIDDPRAILSALNVRSRIHVVIETEYDPHDPTKRSVLFEGYIDRADGVLKGTICNEGLSQGGAARAWPSPDWKGYNCTVSGMWRKGREKLAFFRQPLVGDPNAPDPNNAGGLLPYRVSDVCRKLIESMGFPPNQIDVPDSPIRFWPSADGSGNDALIDPLTELLEACTHFLHEYIGWNLLWDGNAQNGGRRGMQRARKPKFAPYTNLAQFTLDPLPGGFGPKAALRPESYGSVNWVGSENRDDGPVKTWIRKRTFHTYTKAPEATAVIVTGTGDILPNNAGQYQRSNWAWNPKSFDYFRAGGALKKTADQTDPDYIGEFLPVVVVNTSLPTQPAVDTLTRRTYDQGCRAVKIAQFEAPLLLVWDWDDPYQVAPRPLRYYDPVQVIKGGGATQWLVRCCNPVYSKDHIQMAYYELEAPNR